MSHMSSGSMDGTIANSIPYADSVEYTSSEASSRRSAPSEVTGREWLLAKVCHGSRILQQALTSCDGEKERLLLARELRGHVREAATCPHANHVLQMCLQRLDPSSMDLVVDELCEGGVAPIIRHKYGHRIILRLFESCRAQQLKAITDAILHDIVGLCEHAHGNYIVQAVLKHATEQHRADVRAVLIQNLRQMGQNVHGCAVLRSALREGRRDQQLLLARRLAEHPGSLISMASTRIGHLVVLHTLRLLPRAEHEIVVAILMEKAPVLQSTRHGSALLDVCSGALERQARILDYLSRTDTF